MTRSGPTLGWCMHRAQLPDRGLLRPPAELQPTRIAVRVGTSEKVPALRWLEPSINSKVWGKTILIRRLLLLGLLPVSLLLTANTQIESSRQLDPLGDEEFQSLSLKLSERPGFFGTDNLVSNETSYLHVNEEIRNNAKPGEAYVGVGPGQNFTYIGIARPSIAFVLDIRRDNLMHHLYYKSLFLLSRDRWEFLSQLFGKPMPEGSPQPSHATAMDLVLFFGALPADGDFALKTFEASWQLLQSRYPELALSTDRIKILNIANRFFQDGLEVRYEIPGRPMLSFFPTFAELMLETDLKGKRGHYLESEEAFQFVKALQEANGIIPVVGNFAGTDALSAIAEQIRTRGLTVSVFYLSNVEFYLFRSHTYHRFVNNVRKLPISRNSILIRSYFNNWFGTWRTHPHAVASYFSTSLAQYISRFLEMDAARPYTHYWEMVTRDYIGAPNRPVPVL